MRSPDGASRVLPQDVSIVFQGAIGSASSAERQHARRALQSAVRFFPGSEVILSTWKGTVDESFPGVLTVECEDPGPIACAGNEIINLNRQLVSSRRGLAVATRPWAIKLRTDMYFTHGDVFRWLERIEGPCNGVTEARIIVLNTTSINPHRYQPYPFMVCDWLYAGTRADVARLFAVPDYPAEYVHWFTPASKPANDPYQGPLCRYYAETYLWYHRVKDSVDVELHHSSDNRPQVVAASEEILARNLVMLTPDRAGVASSKHKLPVFYHHNNYTYVEWVGLVERHGIPHSLPRPLVDVERALAQYHHLVEPRLVRTWNLFLAYLRRFERVARRALRGGKRPDR